MSLVRSSLRRPITVVVLMISCALLGLFSIKQMPRDIFPNLGIPVIYVAQPFGGMDPSQMEGYLTYYYEYHFLFIPGIEHMESRNIQGTALIKLQFQPDTNMAEALAETINYVNRAKAYMPPGTLPPFIMRFDAGSQPIGNLVFTSETSNLGRLQDFALNYVRPLFATLPGVSAPAPFGASQRAVVVNVDPEKLRKFNLSPYDVAESVSDSNKVVASGNIRVGDFYPRVPLNSTVTDIQELMDVPIRTGTYPTVFLKDVATVEDGTDIQTGYALVNGRRTVYIPITKQGDASTLSVVDEVKQNLSRFQSVLPKDIHVSYEFDQSGYIRRAIASLAFEGILGALLAGLMVFLFFRDWRSSLIVILSVPLAILAATSALWLSGETINIMTLGGLALAIGILVDEVTVVIENIHSHLSRGEPLSRAALDATSEVMLPQFLAMACILAVFLPAFFMTGVPRALFLPLALAVGFAVAASFVISGSLIPVLSVWSLSHRGHLLSAERAANSRLRTAQDFYASILEWLFKRKFRTLLGYFAGAIILGILIIQLVGREIFPRVDTGQIGMRIRAPAGTAIDVTESLVNRVLDIVKSEAGPDNVESSIGFVGTQPASFPINAIYLWTSGPQEAVLEVALKPKSGIKVEPFKELLRKRFRTELPHVDISFEATGIINRIMSQDSPTPIEVAVTGPHFDEDRRFAQKIKDSLAQIPALRDLQFNQVFDYPAIAVNIDRRKAGLQGLTVEKIGRAVTPATSSSRYVLRTYWADPKNGVTHQIQVQVEPGHMKSIEDVQNIPVSLNGGAIPLKRIADVSNTTSIGEIDRYNMQRSIKLTANVVGDDLGRVASEIENRIKSLDNVRPEGVTAQLRGQIKPMREMFGGLGRGLAVAIFVVFLLLAANFESVALSLSVLSTVPAVIVGVGLMLVVTSTTLNIESFMGAIMAVGVAAANAILLVTFAERAREAGASPMGAAIQGAKSRLRPILMTSLAMMMGMTPMALGLSEGSQQTAPLGRAVIGGLGLATLATLLVLPLAYASLQRFRPRRSSSLDPDDPGSLQNVG